MMRVRSESGWTLTELLVAMTLMIVVLSATLTSFANFTNNNRRATIQNDQQDAARTTIDQMVRQLRNLANPTTANPTIDSAGNFNLVFQTTDPTKQWVRYCLNAGELYYEIGARQNGGGPPSYSAGTCPDTGSWSVRQLVKSVTNATGTRPLFAYQALGASGTMPTPVASGDLSKIVRVSVSIFIDVDPARLPEETAIGSGADLRNQNQPPTARFVAYRGTGNTYTLDGGASTDPEQRTLKFDWYVGPVPSSSLDPSALQDCSKSPPDAANTTPWNFTCIGTGPVLTHDLTNDPGLFGNPARKNVWLRVSDPGALTDVSDVGASNACPLPSSATRTQEQCEAVLIG